VPSKGWVAGCFGSGFGGDDSPIVVGVVRQNVQARRGDVDQQLHGVRR